MLTNLIMHAHKDKQADNRLPSAADRQRRHTNYFLHHAIGLID